MSLKLFRFEVQNMTTEERTAFIGQGNGVEEAFKEGIKNLAALPLSVHGDCGIKTKTLGEFETAVAPADEAIDFA